MENKRLKDLLAPPEEAKPFWFQQRGRDFERFLVQIFSKEDMEPSTSIRPSGEEIDGSFSIENSFFLLEAKWHKTPIPASSLYSFKGKVDGKLTGTIGVFFSMSDYSKDAIDALLNGKELNMILFGHTDLCLIDAGEITMREGMRAKLRYAANYGQPFYPLETYLSSAKQADIASTTKDHITNKWNILVEGEQDVGAIQALLDRFEIDTDSSVMPAGGQLAIAQLAHSISKNDAVKLAAILTPFSNPEIQAEQIKKLKDIGAEVVILPQEIEGWLESFVSADYYNATIMLTNRNGKLGRRYARNADLQLLLSKTPSFATLIDKMGAKQK
ncbi:restriction endonuclease [Halomonas sp. BLK-85]